MGRRKFFLVDVNFQTAIVTLFRYRFFHFYINQHHGPTNTSYKISAKYTISFAIFSNGGLTEFSIRLNVTVLKPWSLIMLHMKFKIHGCSGLREKVI